MIYINNDKFESIYYGNNVSEKGGTITNIYCGLDVVWSMINSCFGSGYWLNSSPWSNTDGWKNN